MAMLSFLQTKRQKLQEQQDIVYALIRSGDRIPELEEYFDIYLSLMGKYSGNIHSQLLAASIFVKFAKTFIVAETKHLSDERVNEMRAAAKRMLLGMRDGYSHDHSSL